MSLVSRLSSLVCRLSASGLIFGLAAPSAWATAAVNCIAGDPTLDPCGGICAYDSATDTMKCTTACNAGDFASAWAVTNYGGINPNEIDAWGECTGAGGTYNKFCCSITSTAGDPVSILDLVGQDPGCDDLHFMSGTDSLAPINGDDLAGLMEGLGNTCVDPIECEYLEGSDYVGSDYVDIIYGGDGDDCIYGHADKDLLFGEGGADLIYGDGGADRINGGAGVDTIYGGGGDDTICSYVADCSHDIAHGETGTDKLWAGKSATGCDVSFTTWDPGLEPSEPCGHSAYFGVLPVGCDSGITTEPASCVHP